MEDGKPHSLLTPGKIRLLKSSSPYNVFPLLCAPFQVHTSPPLFNVVTYD